MNPGEIADAIKAFLEAGEEVPENLLDQACEALYRLQGLLD